MSAMLILAAIGLAGIIVLFLLRTNPAVAFSALIIGGILQRVLQNESLNVVRSLLPTGKMPADSVAGLLLLLMPVVLAMLLSRKRGHPKHRLPGYIVLLCFGAALIYLVVPLLPPGVVQQLVRSGAYSKIEPYLIIAIVIGGVLGVMLLANSMPKHDSHHHRRHR